MKKGSYTGTGIALGLSFGFICGLTVNMLFVPTVANMASEAEIAAAGGLTAYILLMGLSVFFKFETAAVAIGTVILIALDCSALFPSQPYPWSTDQG